MVRLNLLLLVSLVGVFFLAVGCQNPTDTSTPTSPQLNLIAQDGVTLVKIAAGSGAQILYTADGTDPRISSTAQVYRSSLALFSNILPKTVTLRVFARSLSNRQSSSVKQAEVSVSANPHFLGTEYSVILDDTFAQSGVFRFTDLKGSYFVEAVPSADIVESGNMAVGSIEYVVQGERIRILGRNFQSETVSLQTLRAPEANATIVASYGVSAASWTGAPTGGPVQEATWTSADGYGDLETSTFLTSPDALAASTGVLPGIGKLATAAWASGIYMSVSSDPTNTKEWFWAVVGKKTLSQDIVDYLKKQNPSATINGSTPIKVTVRVKSLVGALIRPLGGNTLSTSNVFDAIFGILSGVKSFYRTIVSNNGDSGNFITITLA